MHIYFQNKYLIHNTLLPYFRDEYPLKFVNKEFYRLNHEKYNTHIQPHGIIVTYHQDSKNVKERKTYVNGKLHGLYKSWYLNGGLRCQCNYKNDKLNGLYEIWWDTRSDATERSSGQLCQRCTYKSGIPDGLWEEWYYDGRLRDKTNYKNGKEDGLSEQWYVNGQLNSRCYLKDGNRDGLFQVWYDNGKLNYTFNFKNGKVIF